MNAEEARRDATDAQTHDDATSLASEALARPVAPVGPTAVYIDVWMGRERWRCSLEDYDGISPAAVGRHIAVTHVDPPAPTDTERAERMGIIIATR